MQLFIMWRQKYHLYYIICILREVQVLLVTPLPILRIAVYFHNSFKRIRKEEGYFFIIIYITIYLLLVVVNILCSFGSRDAFKNPNLKYTKTQRTSNTTFQQSAVEEAGVWNSSWSICSLANRSGTSVRLANQVQEERKPPSVHEALRKALVEI